MPRALALLLAAGLAACVRPTLVDCGELACADSQVCHAGRCLDPSLLAACEPPVGEGTACDALGAPGHCTSGVCEVATCGDGYVDGELREACDGALPDAHCIDFGYDLGRPACTTCQPDPSVGCTHVGWERVIDAATLALWTDGTTFAYLTEGGLVVHRPTGDLLVPGELRGVHGGGERVVAWNTVELVEVAGTAVTTRELADIRSVRVADDGTIYALLGCQVVRLQGDQQIPIGPLVGGAGDTCERLEVGPTATGRRLFATAVSSASGSTATIYEWNAAAAKFVTVRSANAGVDDLRLDGDTLWFVNGTGAFGVRGPTFINPGLTFGPTSIAFAGDEVFVADDSGTIVRLRDGRAERFHAPGRITGDGTNVYSFRGPIDRFTGIDYGAMPPLPAQLQVVGAVDDRDGMAVVAARGELYRSNLDDSAWQELDVPRWTAPLRAIAGRDPDYFVSSFGDAPGPRAPLLFVTASIDAATSWMPMDVPSRPLLYGLWWDAASRTLFAVGDNDEGEGFFGWYDTIWHTQSAAGCVVRCVHALDATHAVAVGGCGDGGATAAVWTFDGATWTELARPAVPGPLAGVRAFAGGALAAVGPGGAAWTDGSAWSTDTHVTGGTVAGTSLADIWVSGRFTSVQRFDGAVWSKLAVQASGPIAVTANAQRVLFPGAVEDFVSLVR